MTHLTVSSGLKTIKHIVAPAFNKMSLNSFARSVLIAESNIEIPIFKSTHLKERI